ncbi:hypothetical protein, variant 1 [Fonticula alba]|nr:hypothetical protein, variant 1 [Fonticula alba]KCV70115.1 hypothetical protein, variant 1 [Fonticula alba]|eukprot:XP_009495721.1 hypothetical protein, variant 1 [Fonticula alba]
MVLSAVVDLIGPGDFRPPAVTPAAGPQHHVADSTLIAAAMLLRTMDYDAVLLERAEVGRCGYPLCGMRIQSVDARFLLQDGVPSRQPVPDPADAEDLDAVSGVRGGAPPAGRVFPFEEMFCSIGCQSASEIFSRQIPAGPPHARAGLDRLPGLTPPDTMAAFADRGLMSRRADIAWRQLQAQARAAGPGKIVLLPPSGLVDGSVSAKRTLEASVHDALATLDAAARREAADSTARAILTDASVADIEQKVPDLLQAVEKLVVKERRPEEVAAAREAKSARAVGDLRAAVEGLTLTEAKPAAGSAATSAGAGASAAVAAAAAAIATPREDMESAAGGGWSDLSDNDFDQSASSGDDGDSWASDSDDPEHEAEEEAEEADDPDGGPAGGSGAAAASVPSGFLSISLTTNPKAGDVDRDLPAALERAGQPAELAVARARSLFGINIAEAKERARLARMVEGHSAVRKVPHGHGADLAALATSGPAPHEPMVIDGAAAAAAAAAGLEPGVGATAAAPEPDIRLDGWFRFSGEAGRAGAGASGRRSRTAQASPVDRVETLLLGVATVSSRAALSEVRGLTAAGRAVEKRQRAPGIPCYSADECRQGLERLLAGQASVSGTHRRGAADERPAPGRVAAAAIAAAAAVDTTALPALRPRAHDGLAPREHTRQALLADALVEAVRQLHRRLDARLLEHHRQAGGQAATPSPVVAAALAGPLSSAADLDLLDLGPPGTATGPRPGIGALRLRAFAAACYTVSDSAGLAGAPTLMAAVLTRALLAWDTARTASWSLDVGPVGGGLFGLEPADARLPDDGGVRFAWLAAYAPAFGVSVVASADADPQDQADDRSLALVDDVLAAYLAGCLGTAPTGPGRAAAPPPAAALAAARQAMRTLWCALTAG